MLVGWFEPHCKTAFVEGPPDNFEFSLLEDDWEHLEPHLLDLFEHIPGIENAQIEQINGPESFTYDNAMLVGEAPGKPGYFVAAGMCSSGIAACGGVGSQVSSWIRDGKPPVITTGTDLLRVPQFVTQRYCREKAIEVLHDHYTVHLPKQESAEHDNVRGIRRSPLYTTLAAQGARFGSKAGWERPNYFDRPRGEQQLQLFQVRRPPPSLSLSLFPPKFLAELSGQPRIVLGRIHKGVYRRTAWTCQSSAGTRRNGWSTSAPSTSPAARGLSCSTRRALLRSETNTTRCFHFPAFLSAAIDQSMSIHQGRLRPAAIGKLHN